ncbi:Chloroperoxidase [Coprinopsis sp. MPI-PUGE-AT-0042]|nr:Chloroperoxidase [Coprinopsis sp. MPI-PUGE-AT-0042]
MFPYLLSRVLLATLASSSSIVLAFPHYASLAGVSGRQLAQALPETAAVVPGMTPGPLAFTGKKLVHDAAHPYIAPGPGDQRGPCPGLNVLANHGYLPRTGVATPAQIIEAVQEGFNMHYTAARVAAYGAHLLNGNQVSDLLSIGGKTHLTGPSPAPPAHAGGNNVHNTCEGDVSLSRADAYFGDGHSFNQTIFDKFIEYSEMYGGGYYTLAVAQEYVWSRIQDSIHTNPEFNIANTRYSGMYGTAAFPLQFFVDGRIGPPNVQSARLSIENATLIFRDGRFPEDFWRPSAPTGTDGMQEIFSAHPIGPGRNVGGVDNYVEDPESPVKTIFDICGTYKHLVDSTVQLYPEPEGVLRRNLIINLKNLYAPVAPIGCDEIMPYGSA